LWKARADLAVSDISSLVVSSVVSFASALVAVKFLLRYVSKHSFAAFAWYRILFGGVILVTAWTGLVRW
jgi:undecaprenyl-diphosphatase